MRTNAVNLIAHLQMQDLIGKQRHASTKDALNVDAVIAAQMQFSESHSVNLIFADQNVAGN